MADLRRFGPLDETRAWTCLGLNLAVLPGLGSVLAGRRAAGVGQAVIASVGAALSTWWLVLLARRWLEEGFIAADGGGDLAIGVAGVVLFAIAWLWSLATSLSVIRRLRTPEEKPQRHRDTENGKRESR